MAGDDDSMQDGERSGRPRRTPFLVASGFLAAFGASVLTVILTGLYVRGPGARAPDIEPAPAAAAGRRLAEPRPERGIGGDFGREIERQADRAVEEPPERPFERNAEPPRDEERETGQASDPRLLGEGEPQILREGEPESGR